MDLDALAHRVGSWLDEQVVVGERIVDGDEADVWTLNADSRRYVLHVLETPSRTEDELSFCHQVAIHAAADVPEAVPPMVVGEESFIRWDSKLVSVYPFVERATLDRNASVRSDRPHVCSPPFTDRC